MKKSVLTLLAVCFAVALWADDIIITRDSQRINAKIEEIGIDVVKYRKSDNLNGPIYTMAKSAISSIVYDNGQVEAFSAQRNDTQVLTQNPQTAIIKNGSYYESNGTQLSAREYARLLYNTCPAAYATYTRGNKLLVGGVTAAIGGVLLIAPVGVLLYKFSWGRTLPNENGVYLYDPQWAASIAMFSIGGAAIVSSIPLFCIASKRMNESTAIYNRHCADYNNSNLSLNLTAGINGIGLALNF